MLYTGTIVGKTLSFTGCSQRFITQEYVNWLNNPDINRFLETRFQHQSLESVAEYVQKVADSNYEWLFAVLDNGIHIGNIHFTLQPNHNVCYFGYFIGNTQNWGHGKPIEMNQFTCWYAFNKLGADRIEGGAYASNVFSIKAMLKAGFVEEGIKRKAILLRDGKRDDVYIVGILKDEYNNSSFNTIDFVEEDVV